ncbi:MAG: hypothetical protein NW200_01640 [Hyphomonadaceae bacterium]|nr:hypothetical protein [Hyphomonadaceae bacterium]
MKPPPHRLEPRATISVLLRHRLIRCVLIAMWGVGMAIMVAPLPTLAWTAATMVAALVRMEIEQRRYGGAENRRFDAVFILISFVTCAFWAAAPLMIWFSGHPAAEAAAMLYLAAGWILFGTQLRAAPHAMALVTAPFTLAALILAADAFHTGGAGLATLAAIVVFAAAMIVQTGLSARVEREMALAHDDRRQLVAQLRLAVDSIDAVS